MVSYTMYPEEGQTSFSRSRNAMSPQAMQASGLGGAALHEGHEGHQVHQCYRFFADYARCYALAIEDKECRMEWEDYLECRTHVKEKNRVLTITDQFIANKRNEGLSRIEIRRQLNQGMNASIGLIQADADLEKKAREAAARGKDKETNGLYNDGKVKHPMSFGSAL